MQMDDITIKYWSPHGRQEETKFQKGHKKIDLVMRAARRIDLSNIRECSGLEKLDLSHNMLDDLDLSPLAGNSTLQELHIQDNHLANLNLWPLVGCTKLRAIDLSDNRLRGLDITPIFLTTKIRIDSSTVISADELLRFVFTKEQLRERFQLIRTDGAPWTAPPVIMWLSYRELTQKFDWNGIRRRITSTLEKMPSEKWYGAQRGMLIGLGMEELAGLDGNPADLLRSTMDDMSFKDARHIIFDNTIELIESQIERDGPTLFLDMEKMRKTGASKLIPKIAERRREEVENACLYIKGSKVFLEELWMTHYGYQLLAASKIGLTTDLEGLESIKSSFEELGMKIRTENTLDDFPRMDFVSESMRSHVLHLIGGAYD
jgi:hypothetical protein